MTISQLIGILEQLPQELEIYIAVLGRNSDTAGEIAIVPVTESCSDETVIGYMVTDQQSQEVH